MGRWSKEISDFISSLGINPVYPATLMMLTISYFNLNKLKKWDELELYDKMFTTVTWICTILAVLGCIINILIDFGIIKN